MSSVHNRPRRALTVAACASLALGLGAVMPTAQAAPNDAPLGITGSWTDASGRAWRTECDPALTGRNGCRTYAEADVIAAVTVNGVRGYRWETRMALNNIVRFR
ncbi:hypothetical protein BW733_07410 [Tessaracoccus flavescens]|uniref:Uncharacterized protein n=2 Tax=Tessaracoccus flavescens TaxID=399497 RepID=A0A1Q2CX77_9ACTN|nr:hypothetical protein BW733_07410 [Tessaracoccus flavescens]